MPKLFVVAPHSYCDPQNPDRHCDRVALAAVNEIGSCDAPNHFIFNAKTADKLRTVAHDYNRPNTDNTQWRDDLRTRVKREKPDFVLEIHSFPGDHEMYQRLWHSADLAVFASDHNKLWVDSLVAKIKSRIPSGYRIEIVKPWHAVAITDDMVAIRATEPGCDRLLHSLLEFNEDMPSERIPVLARAVYEAALEVIKQNRSLIHSVSGSVASGGVASGGVASGFDAATIHPATIMDPRAKNMCGLKVLIVMLMLLSLILIGIGRTIFSHAYDVMFPQLRRRQPYEID